MSTLSAYAGRDIDLCVFDGVKREGEAAITLRLTNTVCTGAQKLLQQVAKLLLTSRGSDPYDLEAGTDFIVAARRGAIRDDTEASSLMNTAFSQIARQVRSATSDSAPLDEQLTDLQLKSLSFLGDRIAATVGITTADSRRQVILPIDIPLT